MRIYFSVQILKKNASLKQLLQLIMLLWFRCLKRVWRKDPEIHKQEYKKKNNKPFPHTKKKKNKHK
jgi:hypothetical protein